MTSGNCDFLFEIICGKCCKQVKIFVVPIIVRKHWRFMMGLAKESTPSDSDKIAWHSN
ncbi:hypothetical protein BVRB_8g191010 [Beta vulgaris subsp. vulgaris]|nr:hypothetical protein BVRB_8g191010 [Beta vulgaris subsp. vulgaris]